MTKHSHESIHNFRLFTGPVIKVLTELGINAVLNGRNDITVSDRKISGNAQFTDTRSMFSHGTLLFDTKLEDVVNALNVKKEKIESKGIKSVRSRVANISEFLSRKITIDEFKKNIIESVFAGREDDFVFRLSNEQWDDVMKLSESKYRSWDWNYGRSPEFDLRKTKRFSFGQIDFRINVKDGIITEVRIYGDFLGHGELSDIEEILTGVKFEEESIRFAIKNFDLKNYFGDITDEEMANFIVS